MKLLLLSVFAFSLAATPALARAAGSEADRAPSLAPVAIAIGAESVPVGMEVTVPVTVGDLGGQIVLAYQIEVIYDPDVVTALEPSTSGTLTSQWSTASNVPTPGRLVISAASATGLLGPGTLIQLRFEGAAIGETTLTFAEVTLNEGDPSADATGGSVTVTSPTDIPSGPKAFSFSVSPPYPNPTAQRTTVQIDSELSQVASVRVVDMTGRTVLDVDLVQLLAGTSVDLRLGPGILPAGSYRIVVSSKSGTRSVPLMVMR